MLRNFAFPDDKKAQEAKKEEKKKSPIEPEDADFEASGDPLGGGIKLNLAEGTEAFSKVGKKKEEKKVAQALPGMGFPGMMPEGPEMANPYALPELNEDEIMKMQMVSQFYAKVMEGSATPEMIEQAKTLFGEKETEELLHQVGSMPEEEKKSFKEYQEMYKLMAGQFEEAFKSAGVDLSNPEAGPENMAKAMNAVFTNVIKESSTNPKLEQAINASGFGAYSKDILYPPLKKLKDLYPDWIEKNKEKISSADLDKYKEQLSIITQICTILESDDKGTTKILGLVCELMQNGTPPEELSQQVDIAEALMKSGLDKAKMEPEEEQIGKEESKK